MPAKPRHKRGKISPQARRRREEVRGPTTVAAAATSPPAQTALAQAPAAQSAAARPAVRPTKGTAAALSTMQTMSHQQVGAELRTIGAITAILVILLVVLSFVLR